MRNFHPPLPAGLSRRFLHNHGVLRKAQQAVLGHANPNTPLVYGETNETAKRQAVEELGKLIFAKLQLPLQSGRLTDRNRKE